MSYNQYRNRNRLRGLNDDFLDGVQYRTGTAVATTRPRTGNQQLLQDVYSNIIGYLDNNGYKSATRTDKWVGKDNQGKLYVLTGILEDNPTVYPLTLITDSELQQSLPPSPPSENPCPCVNCRTEKVYETRYLSKDKKRADDIQVKVKRKMIICQDTSKVMIECEDELAQLKNSRGLTGIRAWA